MKHTPRWPFRRRADSPPCLTALRPKSARACISLISVRRGISGHADRPSFFSFFQNFFLNFFFFKKREKSLIYFLWSGTCPAEWKKDPPALFILLASDCHRRLNSTIRLPPRLLLLLFFLNFFKEMKYFVDCVAIHQIYLTRHVPRLVV